MIKKILSLFVVGLWLTCFCSAVSSSIVSSNDFQAQSYYNFNPWNDLQSSSITDWFICVVVSDNRQVWLIDISDSYWNKYLQVSTQAYYNTNNVPVCAYLPDFSLNYTLQAYGDFQTVYYYYMYAWRTTCPICPDVYTWVMQIKLYNWNNNSVNIIPYEFSPYSQYQAVYSIYYTWVQTTTMQNWVLFEWNDCSQSISWLNACMSSLNSCSTDLWNCQSDLATATGYVSSLEDEINQCSQDLLNCSSSTSSWLCTTWDNWSALYVNNIQHLWKPIINISIPDEISWDYVSTWDLFDLSVEWYNVDFEYIEWVINKQNYTPTSEDFTEVISNFGSFGGLIVVCLFVILVFYMIKKIFS